jgi:uncharacterized membrane protein YidH (DUF202 family)
MKGAISTYGPDAVHVVMLSFRVEAGQQILGGIFLIGLLICLIALGKKSWNYFSEMEEKSRTKSEEEGAQFMKWASSVVFTIIGIFCLVSAYGAVSDLSAWMAVFGWPELRIATKALHAAGLM